MITNPSLPCQGALAAIVASVTPVATTAIEAAAASYPASYATVCASALSATLPTHTVLPVLDLASLGKQWAAAVPA